MAGMKRKLRRIGSLAVAWLPSGGMRLAAYRLLFGYKLHPTTRIGIGVVIDVESFQCAEGCSIGSANRFEGPMRVQLGRNVLIGRGNLFTTGGAASDPAKADRNYARAFVAEDDVLIHEQHLFDLYGLVHIGKGSWIAGFRSQFLTHGLSVVERDIAIGPGSYLGSGILVSPGSGVGARSVVAMGTVVTSRLLEEDVLIGGVPARVLRQRRAEDAHAFERGQW